MRATKGVCMHFCKKILAPILLLVLIFTLVACGETVKSPYDLARENGYTGSVSDWLADLKGDDLDIEDIYDAAVRNGYQVILGSAKSGSC